MSYPFNPVVFLLLSLTCCCAAHAQSLQQREETALQLQRAAWLDSAQKDWSQQAFTVNGYTLKFMYKVFGNKPAGGRSLYISLHGGGGVPAAANDQQWQNQLRLYTPAEGVYVVPRAPTDTWNMWHQAYMDTLLARLIKDAIVMEAVNPDKVYIMGYSAGGDGVYQLAPRLADHWAAASMMAGHPGDASLLPLYNLPFAIYAGGKDAAYNRNELAVEYGQKLDSLAAAHPGAYIHDVHVYPDMPHWMQRKDTIAVPWMAAFTRHPFPDKVVWVQDDVHRCRFYWLGTTAADGRTGATVIASRKDNTITIGQSDVPVLIIYLNPQMVDFKKKVSVYYKGKRIYNKKPRYDRRLLKQTAATLDPGQVFAAKIRLQLPGQ